MVRFDRFGKVELKKKKKNRGYNVALGCPVSGCQAVIPTHVDVLVKPRIIVQSVVSEATGLRNPEGIVVICAPHAPSREQLFSQPPGIYHATPALPSSSLFSLPGCPPWHLPVSVLAAEIYGLFFFSFARLLGFLEFRKFLSWGSIQEFQFGSSRWASSWFLLMPEFLAVLV
jgi:hypothetical protein